MNLNKNFTNRVWIKIFVSINFILVNSSNSNHLNKISENSDSLYIKEILRASKAAEIKSYINTDINPCDDFYKFACSRYPKLHRAKMDEISSPLQSIKETLKNKIEIFLNKPENEIDTPIDKKVKKFYKSCLNFKDESTDIYKSKFTKFISEFGKMPVLSGNKNWDEEKFDWIEMLAKMQREYGVSALLKLEVAPVFLNNSINCLYIGQPKMLFETGIMYNENTTQPFRNLMILKITKELETFLNVPKKLANQTASEIMSFEIMLSKDMWRYHGKNTDWTWLSALQQKFENFIDIKHLIHLIYGDVNADCFFEVPSLYNENLIDVIPKVPKYIVANYLFYMLLKNDFFNENKTTDAQKALCVDKATMYFNKYMNNIINQHFINKNSENEIKFIHEHLKLSLKHTFDEFKENSENYWFDDYLRTMSKEKLNETQYKLNLDTYENVVFEYNNLTITTDYFENIKNLLFLKGKKLAQIINEQPKLNDEISPLSPIPVYGVQDNKIHIPVAMLHPNGLWSEVYPNSIKFGNLGHLLGRELIHGFDTRGLKFSKNGNEIIGNYEREYKSSVGYLQNVDYCFAEQYDQYRVGDIMLIKPQFFLENIADNGGLRLAYDAYKRWYNTSSRSVDEIKFETFSQLNYTNSQLFFISYAQLLCTDMSENLKYFQVLTDTFLPNMYRVNIPVSNIPEFSTAFNCPINSRMNPGRKCKLY